MAETGKVMIKDFAPQKPGGIRGVDQHHL